MPLKAFDKVKEFGCFNSTWEEVFIQLQQEELAMAHPLGMQTNKQAILLSRMTSQGLWMSLLSCDGSRG